MGGWWAVKVKQIITITYIVSASQLYKKFQRICANLFSYSRHTHLYTVRMKGVGPTPSPVATPLGGKGWEGERRFCVRDVPGAAHWPLADACKYSPAGRSTKWATAILLRTWMGDGHAMWCHCYVNVLSDESESRICCNVISHIVWWNVIKFISLNAISRIININTTAIQSLWIVTHIRHLRHALYGRRHVQR